MSLYDQWQEVAAGRSDELALVDFASGERWTFERLREAGEQSSSFREGQSGPLVFLTGHSADFVISLLRAWRLGLVVCPLESGQAVPAIPPPAAGCVHLKLTSASGGTAKCAAFTGEQLAADARNIVHTMGLRPDWPNLACISMAHSYGFSNLVLPLLLHGIPLVILPAPLPETLIRASREFPWLTLAAVPALWRIWHESKAIPANVRLAISAGAPLGLELEAAVFKSAGLKIHNFYGSSECGGIAYDRSNEPRSDAAFVGTPLEGVRLSLGERGTLVVESEAVGIGYWPESSPALGNGRFETSDLADFPDFAKGGVHLRGRAGDLINVAGRKVAPEKIEEALRLHPAVRECVIFGIADRNAERSEVIAACVNLASARGEPDISELAGFLSTRLPAWQIPRDWWFTGELAVNARGKLSRAEWKRRFLERKTASAR